MSGLACLLLGYVVGLAALATLWPFDFSRHHHAWTADATVEDVVLNLGLLFPAGFLWRLAGGGRRWPYGLDTLALGLGLSLLLECLQMFLPSRCPSAIDVWTNGLGAWAGAATHGRLQPWLERRLHDRLCLMLPITKVLYLACPLVALHALNRDRGAALELFPLAAFIAVIAGSLYRHRYTGATRSTVRQAWAYSLGCSLGISLAATPLWLRAPGEGVKLALAALLFAQVAIALGIGIGPGERRFEIAAVRRALPLFALYLIGLGYQPVLPAASAYEPQGAMSGLFVLRDVAAFTLLGYLISQLHGRSGAARWKILLSVGSCVFAAALLFGWLRALAGGSGFAELAVLSVVAAAGVSIHRAEVSLIRAWSQAEDLRRPSKPVSPDFSLPLASVR